MAQTDLEVVRIVRGGHLDAARAEVHLGIIVGDDRDLLVHKRQDHVLADDGLIALVVRVDADAGVAQHRLRARRGNDHLTGAVGQRIADVPEAAGLVDILDLGVGQRRDAMRAPVDDAAALIDQSLLIEAHEHLAHGLRAAVVHREARAIPVAGRAELLLLLDDAVAEPVLPVPDTLEELLAAKVIARQSLLAQLLLDLDLRGDSGVVDARHPQRRIALHPLEADQHILQRGVHRVTHVKLTGHIGGRHDDRERLFVLVALGMEIPAVLPESVQPRLDVLGIVGLR